MSYGYRRYSNSDVTKREILFSIVIVAVLMVIGFAISSVINDKLMESYQKYNTALQINDNQAEFEYGMKTDIGYAFVHGDLKAVDTVSYPEIKGDYSYIRKEKEKYTRHTRTVTERDANGKTHTRTEVYYSWDYADSWKKYCKKISFANVEFKYGKIKFPSANYIDTIYESSKTRYVYYGCKTKYTGTIFTYLKDNTVNDTDFYNKKSIEDTISTLESGGEIVAFWLFWLVLIGIVVFLFCKLDNDWLEDLWKG